MFNQGVILWNAGKIAEAKKQFEGAIAANPNHAEAHYQLGMALVNEGNLAGAATEFETYLKLAPTGPNAATAKGILAHAEEVVIDSAALRARLADVRARIARAAGRAGRDPASIRLVAVSKTFPADYVRAAADAGQIDFGENKVQEALQKMDQTADLAAPLASRRPPAVEQGEKAGALRRRPLGRRRRRWCGKLDEAARPRRTPVELLVQVDLAGEATKHGAREDELPAIFDAARRVRAAAGRRA